MNWHVKIRNNIHFFHWNDTARMQTFRIPVFLWLKKRDKKWKLNYSFSEIKTAFRNMSPQLPLNWNIWLHSYILNSRVLIDELNLCTWFTKICKIVCFYPFFIPNTLKMTSINLERCKSIHLSPTEKWKSMIEVSLIYSSSNLILDN